MDLRTYLETEGDEGRDLVASGADDCPGDSEVYVPETAVVTGLVLLARHAGDGTACDLSAYVAHPAEGAGPVPSVLVVHEN